MSPVYDTYQNPMNLINAQKPLLNANADILSRASGLNLYQIHLHLYLMYASSQDSGKPAHLCRLARTFAACVYDKYPNSMQATKLRLIIASEI